MFKFIYTNSGGGSVELGQKAPFFVTSKSGLSGVDNDISTTTQFNIDGAYLTSQRLATRNIVIKGEMLATSQANLEELRLQLSSVFAPLEVGNLRYEVDGRIYAIDVNVDKMPEFDAPQKNLTLEYSISLTALNPYFWDISEYEKLIPLSRIDNKMTWPLAITSQYKFADIVSGEINKVTNNGDVPTGAIYTLKIGGSVSNIKILNVVNQEYFAIDGTFVAGDIIYLNTVKGSLKLTKTEANGKVTNIIATRGAGSKFFELVKGDNYIQVLAKTGQTAIVTDMQFTPLVIGV